MPKTLRRYASRVARVGSDCLRYRKMIGIPGVVALNYYPGRAIAAPKPLRLAGYAQPVWYRPGTSDLFVVRQIFLENEYQPLVERLGQAPATILDLGANVGYSTRYFLEQFPRSRVIAVEPDPHNFELLEKNTAAYADRVVLVQEAVWSSEGTLMLSSPYSSQRAQWARQLTLDGSGGDAVPVATSTISSLLDRFCPGRVDILKVDIEGAEAEVFAKATDWVDRVGCVATELHRGTSFGDAHGAYVALFGGFAQVRSGELHIGFREPASSGSRA